MVCLCFTMDEEREMIACILMHYQCGLCPMKCCDYDNDGMCWGCVICQVQIDPCWGPRMLTMCCCEFIPCGCIAEELIFTVCCCNPGKETADPTEMHKAAVEAENKAHPKTHAAVPADQA